MTCPKCGDAMKLVLMSQLVCFVCENLTFGWECPRCLEYKLTGCDHVEVMERPAVSMGADAK